MHTHNSSLLILTAMVLATSTAFAAGKHTGGHNDSTPGEPGIAANVTRTILIDAGDDMRFTPADVTVRKGETIRFVIRNTGKVPHEFSLGTQQALEAHYEVMKRFPGMEHEEPNKISLRPGQRGEVIWRFTKAGVVHFACLHVGHYEAGMTGQVTVAAR